jgi:hypothetical protein
VTLLKIKNCPHGCDSQDQPCEVIDHEAVECQVCGATGPNAYTMCPESLCDEALSHLAILLWNARTRDSIQAVIGLVNEPTEEWLRKNGYGDDADELFPDSEFDPEMAGSENPVEDVDELWRAATRTYGEFIGGVEYKYRVLGGVPGARGADGLWYGVPYDLFEEEVEVR